MGSCRTRNCLGQYVIPASQAEANTAEDAADATVTVGRWNVGLRNNQAEVILSRTQGGIVSWVHNGTEHVIRPPKLTTFRPLTDNDRGAGHGFERAQWTVAGRYARCANVAVEQPSDDSVAVTYTYELATPAHTAVTVRYEAQSTGNVRVTIDYPRREGRTVPARIRSGMGTARRVLAPALLRPRPRRLLPRPFAAASAWACGKAPPSRTTHRTWYLRKVATTWVSVGLK